MTKHSGHVLICEPQAEVGSYLETAVTSFGYTVRSVRCHSDVIKTLQSSEIGFSALFLGVPAPNPRALDLLLEIRAADATISVIILGGEWPARDVVAAVRHGATDFLCKRLIRDELERVLASPFESGTVASKPAPQMAKDLSFTSSNPEITVIESRLEKIGLSGVPVLIQGETGSGKEMLARSVHAQSTRASKPFLKLNCAALPSELVESELFGYERGAFTGAFERKAGIFELADGGTILLDEIGDMDIRLQAKLLQVLQDQEFRRIGGKESVKVNVRILAATHRNLEAAIHENTFRQDLYYRLNVIVIHVPPLRERVEDIVALGDFLMRKHADRKSLLPVISEELGDAMRDYDWPGNVRELENYMRRLVIFQDADALASELRARITRKPPASVANFESRTATPERREEAHIFEHVSTVNKQAEVTAILTALDSTRWNRKQAAALLKIDYKSLLYKMKKLRIADSPVSVSPPPCVPIRRSATGA